jgi:hypothetical protein
MMTTSTVWLSGYIATSLEFAASADKAAVVIIRIRPVFAPKLPSQ